MSGVAQAAATFCVEAHSMAPQCFYYDALSCRKAAEKADGICTVNADTPIVGQGNSVYCKIRADRVSECIYDDYRTCNAAALRDNSACVRNVFKPKPPEPFKFENGVYN